MEPKRALVRPRVLSPTSGEIVLLEDEILALAERGERGLVWIVGGAGSGKKTALAHLAAVLPASAGVVLRDECDLKVAEPGRLAVACDDPHPERQSRSRTFKLVPWSDDEIIEYLLAAHRGSCASVMRRCGSAVDKSFLFGAPDLWRQVLDVLAADETIPTVKAALRRVIDGRFAAGAVRELSGRWSLAVLQGDHKLGAKIRVAMERHCDFATLLRLLTHSPVLLLLAAERVVGDLHSGERCEFLDRPLAHQLVVESGLLIREDSAAIRRLQDVVSGRDTKKQPTAASLLHAAGIGWRPERHESIWRKLVGQPKYVAPDLHGAFLNGAIWPGISLARMDLSEADLGGADLHEGNLDGASVHRANLRGALLSGANLSDVNANEATLFGADLSYVRAPRGKFHLAAAQEASFEGALLVDASFLCATLDRARFARANLTRANLVSARIDGADFSNADLNGARLTGLVLRLAEFQHCSFCGADLRDCDLEEMTFPGADFQAANLTGALLTATSMPGANFQGAKLVDTGLAEIDWEGADLREADLSGAAFHMGSSRSGLVDSPIASYGSRTGFYTEDYNEQDFKSPEEIRKANLRGADLRGAILDGVDFYLVDLRDARYDPHHEEHLRNCGAILESRVE